MQTYRRKWPYCQTKRCWRRKRARRRQICNQNTKHRSKTSPAEHRGGGRDWCEEQRRAAMARRHPSGAPFPHAPDHRSPTSIPESSGRRPSRTASHPLPSGRPSSIPRRPPVSRGEVDNTFDPSPFPLTPFIAGPMRHRPAVLAAHATSPDPPTSSRNSFCTGRPIHPRSVRRSAFYGKQIRLEVGEFLRMWFLPGHRWSLGMVTLSSRYPSNELVLGLPAL